MAAALANEGEELTRQRKAGARQGVLLANVRAALFDVDGTLCDNHRLHFEAYGRALAELAAGSVGWEDYAGACLRRGKTFEDLLAASGVTFDRRLLFAKKIRCYREVAAGSLRPRAGLQVLWSALRLHGVRLGVVSTGRRSSVEVTLDHCQLPGAPDAIVTRENVGERIKPDPRCYLLAAERLAVAPDACVAFDDAPAGVAAASAAGMRCAGVATPVFDIAELGGAQAVIRDFLQVEPHVLEGGPALAVRGIVRAR